MSPEGLLALQQQLLPLEPLPFLHAHLRQAAVLVLLHPGGEALPGQGAGEAGLRVLLTRRSVQLKHHAGQVAFPGGAVEANDASPLETALRETREEVGLVIPATQVLGRLQARETLSGFEVHPFVAWHGAEPVCALQQEEVAEAFSVPLAGLARAGVRPVEGLWQGQVRQSVGFSPPWQQIWGVTAKILDELLQRLEINTGEMASASGMS